MRLYAETGEWLFTGLSSMDIALPGYPKLYYEEGVAGIVTDFLYEDGYYSVVLNDLLLRDALALTEGVIRCRLVTDGLKTLETFFPRAYTGGGVGALMAPGTWEVRVPYWSIVQVDTYPDLVTTVRESTVYTSVPYEGGYCIQEGNALGRFLLPLLGVAWTPNANLSGWVGLFQVENVCTQGLIAIPWQFPDIAPPSLPPADPGQRIHLIYTNVILQVALGPCSDYWQGSRIEVSSGFGYSGTIPFSAVGMPAFHAEHAFGVQPVAMRGKRFVRQYVFQWERASFTYDTGEGAQRYLDQTAVLVQSPAIDFDQLKLLPLPEITE